jgi:hypothetical protein
MDSRQGYLTVATRSEVFLDYAINLRLSCYFNDPLRPFALVTDKHLLRKLDELGIVHYFNNIVIYDGRNVSWEIKLDLIDLSPFGQTVYIDADSLMIKNPDSAWHVLNDRRFGVQGPEHYDGLWYGQSQTEIMAKMSISYLPKFNGGFLYFDKSDIARNVFETAQDLYQNNYDHLGFRLNHGLQVDEPIIGIAMALHGIKPLPDHTNIMFTILGIEYWFGKMAKLTLSIPKRQVHFKKFGKPVSPIILHCCAGLRDSWRYRKAVRQLKKLVAIPKDNTPVKKK